MDFRELCPYLLTGKIIDYKDSHIVQHMKEPSNAASHVLEKISSSLEIRIDIVFDRFLSILENHGDSRCKELVKEMKRKLSPTGKQ